MRFLPILLALVMPSIGGGLARAQDIEAEDLSGQTEVETPPQPTATEEAPPPSEPAPALEQTDAPAAFDVPPVDESETPVAEEAAPELVTLRGQVLAMGTREPQFGASITFAAEPIGETGDDGRFEIQLPPGRQRLQIQQPGFEPAEVFVEIDAEDRRELLVRLMPRQTGQRFETVVVAPEKQAERIALREEELTRTPGSMGDPLRVIESLPGVSQVVWPVAMYTVRGANPGNTGFFLDGVRLPALYHFALGPSVINPMFIEQVDFYPGGYPARYGRYTSGIVAAQTKTPRTKRTRVSADVRLFDAGGIVVTPLENGKTTVAVGGRYSYSGALLSLLSSEFSMNYWDYQLRAERRVGPGRLTLFAFGSGDSLSRKGDELGIVKPIDIQLLFNRVHLGWRGLVGGGRLRSSVVFGHDRAKSFIPQVNNLPVAVTSMLGVGRLQYSRPISKKWRWEVGADGEIQNLNPDKTEVLIGEQDILRDRVAIMSGAYFSLTMEPWPWLIVSVGLRGDLFAEEGVTKIEPGPRLNARLRLTEGVWLKGNVGRFTQMPSLPVSVPGFENFGLASIGLQKSIQGSLGVEAALAQEATVESNAFVQRMDVTDLASIFNYDIQAPLLELRPGRSYGVEFMVRRPIRHRLYGWLAYTLSKSERAIPPINSVAAADWDQRHIVNLVTSYRLGGGYQIGGRFHYNTGRPYPVFDEGSLVNDRQAVRYSKLPDFYQLDVRFDRRWIFDKFILDAYIELINTTLTEQVFDIKRRTDGSLERLGFRIILPSVGLHAEW